MKRNFILLMMSFLAVAFLACENPQAEDGTDEEGTEEGTGTTGGTETPGGTEDDDKEDSPYPFYEDFPLECSVMLAEGSDVGVTIEVKKVEDNNFVFELRPGAMVQSFKMDVYPMSQLYNNLLNDKNSGVYTEAESWAVNERIRDHLFNQTGSGGYSFSINDFDNDEDFLQIEFDWMNTSYAAASAIAIPDCDYVIAVVASASEDISSANQEDLTLCYLHTTSQPLVGDPQVEIQVNTGYTAFSANHIPNADAAGVYFFGWHQSEIDEYIDTFGDTMFRDFMRTRVTAPSPANNPEMLAYHVNFGEQADSELMSTTCAVAVDANLTPQKGYSRKDFHLDEVPENIEEAEAVFDIIEERVAAAYFEFKINFEANCQTVFWRYYSEEDKERLEAESSVNKKLEAIDIYKGGGDGCHNPNFLWDKETGYPTGSGAVINSEGHGYDAIVPGTTIYIGYTCRNGAQQLSPVKFSEPIHLDARKLDGPNAEVFKDLRLWLDKPTRTSFRQNIEYDPDVVSMVYVQYMYPGNAPALTLDSSWSEWATFIFNPETMESLEYTPIINRWPTVPSGSDPWVWTVTEPDTEYTVFMCAEDFDGNVSPMYFDTIRTAEIQVGPDPTINMSLVPSTLKPNDWTVKYEIDHDVEYFLYCYTDEISMLSPYISGLTQGALNNIAGSGIPYEKWSQGIFNWVAAGFENNGGGMRANGNTSQDWIGDQVVVAACIAVGQDDEGEPVYKMYHLICKDGKAQTLEEIFGIE